MNIQNDWLSFLVQYHDMVQLQLNLSMIHGVSSVGFWYSKIYHVQEETVNSSLHLIIDSGYNALMK